MYRIFRQFATAVLVLLASTLPLQAQAGDSLRRVIDFQVLKVGMSGNQPPLTMTNREGGLMGFDVDLARAMAVAMQVELEIKTMPFGKLMGALENGEVDMVISGMAITPKRTEAVSFVGPYVLSGKSILTTDEALGNITSTEEFNRDNLRLLALDNSTSASFVRNVAPEATLIEIDDYDTGVQQLIAGEADAMVADMPVCVLAVLRHPEAGLTTLEKPLTVEPIGIAISREDAQFRNLVENYLRVYEKTGVLEQLRGKWFEDSAWVAALP